ncbi:PREDICTED: probable serine/threonine-protein kinase DDB_G0288147 isoform X2 [Papilio polytes]|uniref:probable serine/threonine-protein kinase DDB_G0288147 isoform X2 n=1 Tax=Papilio polytes TaxID=76194 RepID=UPI000676637C|nr:PREDICTED: probable serine/threonine-protein kinase DDB_G0288147 isoform X2 [Papilio polytes]
MSQIWETEGQHSDDIVDQILLDYDKTIMSIPDIENEPHLLISKINELKQDTTKGKLYKTLYDFLNTTPKNEKRVQTTLNKSNNCTCQCTCNQRRKRRRENIQNQTITDNVTSTPSEKLLDPSNNSPEQTITKLTEVSVMTMNNVPPETPLHTQNVEPQDSDNLLRQLEILFQDDNNEDDIFEQSLWNDPNPANEEIPNDNNKDNCEPVNIIESNNISTANITQSLDEKLASLAGHFVENNDNNTKSTNKKTNPTSNKWLCEEYFMKLQLYEILDQLRDCNRAKLARVKDILKDIFGEDSDDEGVMSPLEETPEFVRSCKERIAPWVVKVLTPFYIKGRIKGKALFKSLAKHLIRLIYQCSKYPNEYEVKSFVNDFLESHKVIRCEADFKQFRINNI